MKDNQREGQIFYIGSVNLAALQKMFKLEFEIRKTIRQNDIKD